MKKPPTNSDGAKKCRRFYGHGIPNVPIEDIAGKLIVVEGADGSGRSTQIARLVDWLETSGHATVRVALKNSTLALLKEIVTFIVSSFKTRSFGDGRKSDTTLTFSIGSSVYLIFFFI